MFQTVLFRWIEIPGRPALSVEMGIQLDPLTAFLLGNVVLVVAVILIQVRRNRRRRHLPSMGLVLLSLFAAAMLLVSTNVLELFLFWQMTALCGFLLSDSGRTDGSVQLRNSGVAGVGRSEAKETPGIRSSSSSLGHSKTRTNYCPLDRTSVAARRTLLLQLGMDLLLIPGLYLIWVTFGSLEIGEILGRGPLPSEKLIGLLDPLQSADVLSVNRSVLSVICLCLLAAAVGRCGLFPLFRRRDDLTGNSAAVQALIQTAVVMPAGVHLIVRWQRLFAVAPVAQTLMMSLGGLTALLAASIAAAENSSRRRLVFTSASLFGLMFMALGSGTRFGMLGAVGLLSVTTLVMAARILAVGNVSVVDEDKHADDLPNRTQQPVGQWPDGPRRLIAAVFGPLVRLCRQRFYLDAIGVYLFVLPLRSLAVVCRLADRYLLGGRASILFRSVPALVAMTAEPLRSRPTQFNALSLLLSSVVLTALLLWLWR